LSSTPYRFFFSRTTSNFTSRALRQLLFYGFIGVLNIQNGDGALHMTNH
jgi:hypothetical protein